MCIGLGSQHSTPGKFIFFIYITSGQRKSFDLVFKFSRSSKLLKWCKHSFDTKVLPDKLVHRIAPNLVENAQLKLGKFTFTS